MDDFEARLAARLESFLTPSIGSTSNNQSNGNNNETEIGFDFDSEEVR
jgi:hypothetical protein